MIATGPLPFRQPERVRVDDSPMYRPVEVPTARAAALAKQARKNAKRAKEAA